MRDPASIRHVVAFEQAPLQQTESPLLRGNDTFKVRFLEVGHYPYRCQILPRMRASVTVFESVHQIINIPPSLIATTKQAVFSMNSGVQLPPDNKAGAASGIPSKSRSKAAEQHELSQRLIEVLEEEKQLEASPFINKSYFKEVFDKYQDKLKCEAELTSDDQT